MADTKFDTLKNLFIKHGVYGSWGHTHTQMLLRYIESITGLICEDYNVSNTYSFLRNRYDKNVTLWVEKNNTKCMLRLNEFCNKSDQNYISYMLIGFEWANANDIDEKVHLLKTMLNIERAHG